MAAHEKDAVGDASEQPRGTRTLVWLGVAAGLATVGWLAARAGAPRSRRFSDHQPERRNPMHFFLAGNFPRRRRIDQSGHRPVFERRQSVYEAY